jgi:branched-subunit amino acid ABC-type transport system permease component
MFKSVLAAAALLAISACGTQLGDRMASGAAIGGGAGLVAGGVGAIPGAIIGAGVGALTPPERVNLGEPVWDDPAWADTFNDEVDQPADEAPVYEEPDASEPYDDEGNPT